MIRIPTHMTDTFVLVILLLVVLVLHSLVLPIKLSFTIKLALVLELVGLEVFLLYQIGTRSSLNTSSTCVLCSRLFFHIKSANEIHEGGSLVMIPPATNLFDSIQLKCSSSLANDCIS